MCQTFKLPVLNDKIGCNWVSLSSMPAENSWPGQQWNIFYKQSWSAELRCRVNRTDCNSVKPWHMCDMVFVSTHHYDGALTCSCQITFTRNIHSSSWISAQRKQASYIRRSFPGARISNRGGHWRVSGTTLVLVHHVVSASICWMTNHELIIELSHSCVFTSAIVLCCDTHFTVSDVLEDTMDVSYYTNTDYREFLTTSIARKLSSL